MDKLLIGIKSTMETPNERLISSVERNNIAEVQRIVVVERAEVNQCGYMTPLIKAINNGNSEMVKELLRLGADVNFMSELGCPIHYACSSNKFFLVYSLVKAGADVNARDSLDRTPLRIAIENYENFLHENLPRMEIEKKRRICLKIMRYLFTKDDNKELYQDIPPETFIYKYQYP